MQNLFSAQQFLAALQAGQPIVNCDIHDVIDFKDLTVNTVQIKNVQFKSDFNISNSTIEVIEFEEVLFDKDFNLRTLKSKALTLAKVTIEGKMYWDGVSTAFNIKDSKINESAINYGGVSGSIMRTTVFKEMAFNTSINDLDFYENTIKKFRADFMSSQKIRSQDNNYDEFDITFYSHTAGHFETIKDTFQKRLSLKIDGRTSGTAIVRFSNVSKDFIFSISSLTEEIFRIKRLELEMSSSLSRELIIKKGEISTLVLRGINSSILNFQNLTIANFDIVEFTNARELIVSSVVVYKLIIKKTNLGKTYFTDIDTTKIRVVDISDCQLSDIIPTSVKWFTKKQIKKLSTQNGKASNIGAEIWRQFKLASKEVNDIPNYHKFKRAEYLALKEEIPWTWKTAGDRIIIFAAGLNNYGANWIKPVLWVIAVTLIAYFAVLYQLSDSKLTFSPFHGIFDLHYFCLYAKEKFYLFWQMLDPINRLRTTLKGKDLSNGYIQFIDILHRICYAFLLYQIIIAFRKFIDEK